MEVIVFVIVAIAMYAIGWVSGAMAAYNGKGHKVYVSYRKRG